MSLSTHILDTSLGRPVPGVAVTLAHYMESSWQPVYTADTDADGRWKAALAEGAALSPGLYRLRFETAAYFRGHSQASIYPYVEIAFEVGDPVRHFHIPLLLTANGYTTYRGS